MRMCDCTQRALADGSNGAVRDAREISFIWIRDSESRSPIRISLASWPTPLAEAARAR